jgi:hypothetical protein
LALAEKSAEISALGSNYRASIRALRIARAQPLQGETRDFA